MKQRIKETGDFNGWKGNICLYFSSKDIRIIAAETNVKCAIVKNMTIAEVYRLY